MTTLERRRSLDVAEAGDGRGLAEVGSVKVGYYIIERFDAANGEAWTKYVDWSKLAPCVR